MNVMDCTICSFNRCAKLSVYISSYLNRMILMRGGFLRRNLFSLDMDYALMELPIPSPSGMNPWYHWLLFKFLALIFFLTQNVYK